MVFHAQQELKTNLISEYGAGKHVNDAEYLDPEYLTPDELQSLSTEATEPIAKEESPQDSGELAKDQEAPERNKEDEDGREVVDRPRALDARTRAQCQVGDARGQ